MTEDPTDGRDRLQARSGQRFLLILALVLLVLSIFIAWPFRAAIIFALLLGYLLFPVHAWLRKRVPKEWMAALMALLLTAAILIAPFAFLTYSVMGDAMSLARSAAEGNLTQELAGTLNAMGLPGDRIAPLIQNFAGDVASFLQGQVFTILQAATELLLGLIVFFILLFFIFLDGEKLVEYVCHVMPLDRTRRDRLLRRTGERVKAVVFGTILVALLQGVVAGVGWWILGLPAPFFWGSVMVVLELIPIVGAFLILVPVAIVQFMQGNIVTGVGLVILNFIIVGLVDDVIRPYVIGKRSGVHPAIILVGIVGGLFVFGIAGLILGPIIISLLGPVLDAWAHPEDEPLAKPEDV